MSVAVILGCALSATSHVALSQMTTNAPAFSVVVHVDSVRDVFNHERDACEPLDVPDLPATILRLPKTGQLLLLSGDAPRYYVSLGRDVDSFRRLCSEPALTSADSPYPWSYANQEWIATARVSHDTIFALIHNEFHDPRSPGCKRGDTSPSNPCWYNSITAAFSVDGGHSFRHYRDRSNIVAAPPLRWDEIVQSAANSIPRPYGYFSPSRIVQADDGYYYSIFMAITLNGRGVCAMRTSTLSDPSSWRAWNGHSYSTRLGGPYDQTREAGECSLVDAVIKDLHGNLTYNSYLHAFLLVGPWASTSERVDCGLFVAASRDLIAWTKPQLLLAGPLPYAPCGHTRIGTRTLPSLIDFSDTSANLEHTDRRAYLLYVDNVGRFERNLRRVPVEFKLK